MYVKKFSQAVSSVEAKAALAAWTVPVIFLRPILGRPALQPFLREVDFWDDLDITKLSEAFKGHENLRKQG